MGRVIGVPAGGGFRRSIDVGRIQKPGHRVLPGIRGPGPVEVEQAEGRHQSGATGREGFGVFSQSGVVGRELAQPQVVEPLGALEIVAEGLVGNSPGHALRSDVE